MKMGDNKKTNNQKPARQIPEKPTVQSTYREKAANEAPRRKNLEDDK